MMTVLTFLKCLRGIFDVNLKSGTAHHAVIQSIYDSFLMVDGDLDLMRLEMCLATATGKWLDYWGDFFTVQRKNGEKDRDYSNRIIQHVIRPKTTIPAIKDYIVDYLNEEYNKEYTRKDISIREPWMELGKYSHRGVLSSDARMFSQDYWTHAVLDISIPEKLTQDLMDIVLSVKAAGVKIVWSFLNSYDIIKGYNDSDDNWADYARHLELQTKRVTYSGLMLSNTSFSRTLSGRREIWFERTTSYYWYAKMLDKDTDKSIIITKFDLIGLLDFYEKMETLIETKDTGFKPSHNPDGLFGPYKFLSGDLTQEEINIKLVNITSELLQSIKLMDDFIMLSHQKYLSDDGVMFEFTATHEAFTKILHGIAKFKELNPDYYNALQPPILSGEPAMWLVKRNENWLWDTPTMSWEDLMTLWEPAEGQLDHTLHSIEEFERQWKKGYITFGDVYQPPIVIAGSPWYWTPELDMPWLWDSATLTNEELEEIYRRKYSKWPDLVELEKKYIKNPDTDLRLSDNGTISAQKKMVVTHYNSDSENSFRVSDDGVMSHNKLMSGEKAVITTEIVDNPDFKGYHYASGNKSLIEIIRHVKENTPTLGDLIDFEENKDGNKWMYSTRDECQAVIQIGELAMWLINMNYKQLWNTKAITNEEIMDFWEGSDKPTPSDYEAVHLADPVVYQPPIVRADHPYYWTTRSDIPWLWDSATLTNEELDEIYRTKFIEYPELFPDIVQVTPVFTKHPEKEFRLSDNGILSSLEYGEDIEEIKDLEKAFRLSDGGIISNQGKEYITSVEYIKHPEVALDLSNAGKISAHQNELHVTMISHPENSFRLSDDGVFGLKSISGELPERREKIIPNEEFTGYSYMSGQETEVKRTVTEITHDILPLRYLSGAETTVIRTPIITSKLGWNHYMSGSKTIETQKVEILENTPMLETLIKLEESNKDVLYSTREVLQSPIQIIPQ